MKGYVDYLAPVAVEILKLKMSIEKKKKEKSENILVSNFFKIWKKLSDEVMKDV